jgi:hypothetical protein
MKTSLVVSSLFLFVNVPLAVAESHATSTAIEAPAPSLFQLDARFTVIPMGELAGGAGPTGMTVDTELAYGLSAHVGFRLNRYLCLGLAPQYLFQIMADTLGASEASAQFDLLARVTGTIPLTPQIELNGYLAPGLSTYTTLARTDSGIGLAGGFGAAFNVVEGLQMLAEIGYQKSFFDIDGADFKTSFLTTTLGLGTRF